MTFTNVIFILVNSMAKVSILNTLAEINKIKGKFREKKLLNHNTQEYTNK